MTEQLQIKFKNRRYHITGTPYSFNNRKTAETLIKTLTEYQQLKKT